MRNTLLTMWFVSKNSMCMQPLAVEGGIHSPLYVFTMHQVRGVSLPPTYYPSFSSVSLARVPMNQQDESDSLVQQTIYRCCVCSREIPARKVRTCRNPACLQTLCSTGCGILHNWSSCPSAREVEARSNTIRRQAQYESNGGKFWKERGNPQENFGKLSRGAEGAGRRYDFIQRRRRRSRSGLRGDTNVYDMASHTHIPTT